MQFWEFESQTFWDSRVSKLLYTALSTGSLKAEMEQQKQKNEELQKKLQ